ncbi:MAG: glutathione binding-like protein [Acidihalobacter sp.]
MSLVANRRSVMTLFSAPDCPDSHRARIVIAEKDITADIVQIDRTQMSEDLTDDWYSLIYQFDEADKKQQAQLRKRLRESLLTSAPLFMEARPYLLGEEFSLVDCSVIPVLWRLGHYGIQLPPAAAAITGYANSMFERPAVRNSLSEAERDMHV